MIDARRIIYLVMLAAVALPILLGSSAEPSRMVAAEAMYEVVDSVKVEPGNVAMVWLDFGPNTVAENEAQASVILEHLFRRRVPVILLTQYQQAEDFLRSLPKQIAERLAVEYPGQTWRYGEDWINGGYKFGGGIYIQALASSRDVSAFLGRDVYGTPIVQYERFAKIGDIRGIKLVAEVTGLVGVFSTIMQFFQKADYRPTVIHGCTSITIPEAYIFLDSKQLHGLLEGIAGAAWYSKILKDRYPGSDNTKLLVRNTALSSAHLVIIVLIIIGNLPVITQWMRSRHG